MFNPWGLQTTNNDVVIQSYLIRAESRTHHTWATKDPISYAAKSPSGQVEGLGRLEREKNVIALWKFGTLDEKKQKQKIERESLWPYIPGKPMIM